MSRVKETFTVLGELAAMQEYLEDDLETKDTKVVDFHEWAVAQHASYVWQSLSITPESVPQFMDWFYSVLCASDGVLLDEYNNNRLDIANRLFGYYRQAYAKVGA